MTEPRLPSTARLKRQSRMAGAVLGLASMVLILAVAVGRPLLREVRVLIGQTRRIADALTGETARVEFRQYASEVQGMRALQFARLTQVETFRQSDTKRILWNQLELPEVIVEISVPVQFTYTLSLEHDWLFEIQGKHLVVGAPAIDHNAPAPDLSALRFDVVKGSLLRDEDAVMQSLRARITTLLEARAIDNVRLVREAGRTQATEFVKKWLGSRYDDSADYAIEVRFADELAETSPGH